MRYLPCDYAVIELLDTPEFPSLLVFCLDGALGDLGDSVVAQSEPVEGLTLLDVEWPSLLDSINATFEVSNKFNCTYLRPVSVQKHSRGPAR